jgi:MFS superfamily sulfate permease-like transporter
VIEIVRKLPTVYWPTLLVGLVTLVSVIVMEQINKTRPISIRGTVLPIPSSLIVIILGILISFLANFSGLGIKIVGYIPPGFNKVCHQKQVRFVVFDFFFVRLLFQTLISSDLSL